MIQQPIPVPPAPKFFHCDNHPEKTAKNIVFSENSLNIVCEDCRLRNYQNENFFLLDKVFDDPLETFRHTRFPYHPQQYLAQNLLSQHSDWTDQTIDEWGDKLIETVNEQVNLLKSSLKDRLKRFNDYFSDFAFKEQLRNALLDISYEYSYLKEKVSQLQENDPSSIAEAKASIQDYCQKICKQIKRKDEDLKSNEVYKISENIRNNQKLFMNSNVLVEVERKIKDALVYVKENFLCENKFVISKIANHHITKFFEKIQPNDGLRNGLITSLTLIFEKLGNETSQKIADMRSQIIENNVIILIETKSQQVKFFFTQKFGLYYNTSLPTKSLLCSLTKEDIFQATQNISLVIPKPSETAGERPIIQCGTDFVIDDSLTTGSSRLGGAFELRGHNIGDPSEFLANGSTFDIHRLEIFKITDRSINDKQPPPQGPFQPPMMKK